MVRHVTLETCTTQGCAYEGKKRHISLRHHSPRSLGRGLFAVELYMCDCGQILDVVEVKDDPPPVDQGEIDWEDEPSI